MYSPEEESIIKELVAQWAEDADIDEALAYYKQKKSEQPTSIKDVLGGISTKLQWAGKQVVEWGQSLVTNTIRWIGNIAALWVKSAPWVADVLLPWTPIKDAKNKLAGQITRGTEKVASGIEWINKDLSTTSAWAKIWEFASYLTPSIGAETAAVKWMAGMSKLVSQFPKLWKIGTGAMRWLAGGAGYEAAEKGTIGKDTLTQWGIWAVIPWLGILGNTVWRGAADLLGTASGTGTAIKQSFDAGIKWWDELALLRKARSGWVKPVEIVETVQQGLNAIKSDQSKIYKWANWSQFMKDSQKTGMLDNSDIVQNIISKIPWLKNIPDLAKTWSTLDDVGKNELLKGMLKKSKITNTGEIGTLKSLLDDLTDPEAFKKTNLVDLDSLKNRISSYIEDTGTSPWLVEAKNAVLNKIKKFSPVYSEMQTDYNTFNRSIREINDALKPWGNLGTAITKIQNALQDKTGLRQEAIKELERLSGVKLLPTIAGVSTQNILPSGLRGAMITTGGAAAVSTGWWSKIIDVLAYAGLTSPKVLGKTATALGVSKWKYLKAIQALQGKVGNVAPWNIARNLLSKWFNQ